MCDKPLNPNGSVDHKKCFGFQKRSCSKSVSTVDKTWMQGQEIFAILDVQNLYIVVNVSLIQ